MAKQQLNRLRAEFILLFGGLPILMIGEPRAVKFAVLWSFAAYGLFMVLRIYKCRFREEWNWGAVRGGLRFVIYRALVWCSGLNLLVLWLMPERFFSFPMERPLTWAMVMVLYPLLSVMPQEIIYRSLFAHRYASLFPTRGAQLAIAGLIFGWGHIVFLNPVAILLCVAGGLLFTDTYMKHRSLALVAIEHSIYGCFIFTIGLGWYFYGITLVTK